MIIAVVLARGYSHGHSQPGCRDPQEVAQGAWRNAWDPTRFWRCTTLGVPAENVRCPDTYMFLESRLECVPWNDWVWSEPQDPITFP